MQIPTVLLRRNYDILRETRAIDIYSSFQDAFVKVARTPVAAVAYQFCGFSRCRTKWQNFTAHALLLSALEIPAFRILG